jgi:hypothetical protein
MGLREWLTRRGGHAIDPRLRRWRERWAEAVGATDGDQIGRLSNELDAIGGTEDEIEVEREMLQALIEREELAASIRANGLPVLDTGHRIVRGEPCHYSEPVSMPDEPGQPGGRLLFTANRAIFIAGGKTISAAWHSIVRSLHGERDLVFVKNGYEQSYRFRCNTYGDALRAAVIARELQSACRPRTTTAGHEPRKHTDD